MSTIRLSISEHEDTDGQTFIRYTPVLVTDCLACGSLTFAAFDVWKHEPITHGQAQAEALKQARRAMAIISKEACQIAA